MRKTGGPNGNSLQNLSMLEKNLQKSNIDFGEPLRRIYCQREWYGCSPSATNIDRVVEENPLGSEMMLQ